MDIEKVKRSEFVTYLDVAPKDTLSWKILGIGITNYGIAYNPQITTEKWVIEDNARSSHEGNQKQGDVSQKIYKGDDCFEFINNLRDKIGKNVQTHILDIDTYSIVSEGVYKAKKSDCIIAITNYMAEDATIEYSIYYNGDPVEGTVTLENGTPIFTSGSQSL